MKGFRWCRGRNSGVCSEMPVEVFVCLMCTNWCINLSQQFKCNSLMPHKTPELTKLQAASYVGVQ